MKLIFLLFLILPTLVSAQFLRIVRDVLIKPQMSSDEIINPGVISKSYFTVIAPSNIRRGKSYYAYARGIGLNEPIKLSISIIGTSDYGEPLIIKEGVDLTKENSMVKIEINTSTVNKGNYKVHVESTNFSQERSLIYLNKKYTFMVQFSKSIFHPGDLFQFRIFSIDSETKSINPVGANNIKISDQRNNEIKLFSNVTFINGKYENELQLGSKAGLGIYKLEFRYEDEYVFKQFEISEYQLPMVVAKLSVEEKVPFSSGKVSFSIDATYTFGGDASGTSIINFMKFGSLIFSKTVPLTDGSAAFDVDIINDLKITAAQYANLIINLVFTDQLTGEKASDSKNCLIVPKVYEILTKSSLMSKDGPLKFTITVKKYDGSPPPEDFEVKIKSIQPETIQEQSLTLNDEGTISSSIDLPSNTLHILMKVTANDANDAYIQADYVNNVATGSSIEIKILTESPKVNEPVEIKFTVSAPVDFIIVHITSKGLLLENVKLDLNDVPNSVSKSTIFTFKPSFAYAPSANIIAYYISNNRDFITQQCVLKLNDLPNYLTITTHQDVVEPRVNLSIHIESKIDSTVSLLAMDQRLLLLKSGSNFTKTEVLNELNKYSSNSVTYGWGNIANYEYDFGRQGLYVITNLPHPPRYRPIRASRPPDQYRRNEFFKGEYANEEKEEIKVREDFREIFLWRDVNIKKHHGNNNQGLETITEKVPESITTYLIYGVSMSNSDGMGLCDDVPFVTVFLPFFLSAELPYSIKRNEVLVQDIFLFNFLKKTQNVEVKITKDPKYEAVDLSKYGWTDSNGFYLKTIKVVIGKNNKLKFALRPKMIGFIPFQVTAKGPIAGDGLKKQLRVIPEGISRSITKSVFIAIDKSSAHTAEALLQCNLPDSAYQDTTAISATIVGDIFGKSLNNLDKLIHMPGGCGEQTMLSLAPDIAIYAYLVSANKLTPTLKSTLEKYILSGYQNELRYLRNDGSFSAFGTNDPSGSTWLTAYVGLFFYFARNIITIDSNIIRKTVEFVIIHQKTDGSFKEPGRVIHSDMQGGSGNGIALTAYCAIFLTNILPDYPTYKSSRDSAIKYLEDNLNTVTSTYELGIISYALKISASNKSPDAYNSFNAKKTVTDTYIYWTTSTILNNNMPLSLNIEVTSYGLLTNIEYKSSAVDIIKIVKYLISKSNSFGGYSSSQDTVMALYALSQFAKTYSLNAEVNIVLSPNVGAVIPAKVDPTNALTVQSFDFHPLTRMLKVSATTDDSGLAIVSLICNFYEDPLKVISAFEVTTKYTFFCSSRIVLEVCARYIPPGTSNMALMTVSLPSGFVTSGNGRSNNPEVSQTEVANQGTAISFYFNTIPNTKSCILLTAYRAKFVADLKNGSIIVTDYYNTALEGSASLPVPDLNEPCQYSYK